MVDNSSLCCRYPILSTTLFCLPICSCWSAAVPDADIACMALCLAEAYSDGDYSQMSCKNLQQWMKWTSLSASNLLKRIIGTAGSLWRHADCSFLSINYIPEYRVSWEDEKTDHKVYGKIIVLCLCVCMYESFSEEALLYFRGSRSVLKLGV